MHTTIVTWSEPKNRSSALNLAAYMSNQTGVWERKKENLMSNISATKNKMKRLRETLDEYERQLVEINSTQEGWQNRLKELQDLHQLTEAEILETRSALLRSQISALKVQAGVQETGQEKYF